MLTSSLLWLLISVSFQNLKFIVIPVKNERIHVMFRPGAQEFLKKMSTLYEIVIFTASVEAYAIPLMKQLDPERLSTAILWREH
jgi:RNA polymerase II subunit A small phosphatase-like protein